jgi:hypothetical protein
MDVSDMQDIRENMQQLAQNLSNTATSKALSSAYTEFLRYIGQRVHFEKLGTNVEVMVINTIEIPTAEEKDPAKILYDQDEEADGEETARIAQAEAEEAAAFTKQPDGSVVETATGEVIKEAEVVPEAPEPEKAEEPVLTAEPVPAPAAPAPPQEDGKPTRGQLHSSIMAMHQRMNMSNPDFVHYLKHYFGDRTQIKDLSDDEVMTLHGIIADAMADYDKKAAGG